MLETPNYTFAALRGNQASREYYVVMCPLGIIPKLFLFDEEELPPELRAQRTLNRSRIPDIANYVLQNQKDYAFSSITAAIDGEVKFEPLDKTELGQNVGRLVIPMTARLVINDGQHRRAAVEEVLKEKPELADETISVVFFVDKGLRHSQQLFADLNKHAVRPTRSLGILYDRRDPLANLCRKLINEIDIFKGLTETEKTSISNRSNKLFTLSSIHQATRDLLKKRKKSPQITQKEERFAAEYWTTLGNIIPEWRFAKEKSVHTAELRQDYIHVHGVVLHALGKVGACLLEQYPEQWPTHLKKLADLDWRKANIEVWEGRAMRGGQMSKGGQSVQLTANYIKTFLGLELTDKEQKIENTLRS